MNCLGTERSTELKCDTINAHEVMDGVCSVCFPGAGIAATESALRYDVERHASMEALLADLASEDM
jgi:hypothetical protein